MPDILLLLSQIAGILVTARLVGRAVALIGQPRVVGEMLAGIMLGPSLLGWAAPELFHQLFPPASLGFLNALSQIGLVFFMFLIGLELDLKLLRGQRTRGGRHQSRQHHRAVFAGRVPGAVSVPASLRRQRQLHRVRALHGRGHEHDGLPGAGPDPDASAGC